jgi:hypothetical protein
MSINYYLFCIEKYSKILLNLDDIISNFQEINETINNENEVLMTGIVSYHLQNINFFTDKKNYIKILKETYEKKLQELCIHEFIDDLIDINPDRSQHICYCHKCEYIKNN